jgi:DNA-binding MarR family transcriptional regulator
MTVAERSLAKDRLRLWLRLLKATRLVEGALRERMRAERGTTLPRFDVMAALYRAGEGLRMSDLSGVLMVSNGNVTGIVDRLEAEGLVARAAVEGDRRATRVRLTARGREAFEDMAEEHEAWVDGLLAGLTPRETEEAARLLEKIAGGVMAGRGA